MEERPWRYWTKPDFVSVGDSQVALRRDGDGEPMVFLHGAGLTRQWLPFYSSLSESFDLIVPEHPGFGDSPSNTRINSIDDLVLHYDELIRELGITRPHLVGHSLGGWLAASLAVHYPDRFRSLTLISPLGVRTRPGAVADPFRWSQEQAADMLLNGHASSYLEYFEQEGELEDFIREYAENSWFARWTWNPRYDVRFDWRLSRVQAPTQVVHLADDRFVSAEVSRRFSELIPRAAFHEFAGGGHEPTSHLGHLQYPAELSALIKANTAA